MCFQSTSNSCILGTSVSSIRRMNMFVTNVKVEWVLSLSKLHYSRSAWPKKGRPNCSATRDKLIELDFFGSHFLCCRSRYSWLFAHWAQTKQLSFLLCLRQFFVRGKEPSLEQNLIKDAIKSLWNSEIIFLCVFVMLRRALFLHHQLIDAFVKGKPSKKTNAQKSLSKAQKSFASLFAAIPAVL